MEKILKILNYFEQEYELEGWVTNLTPEKTAQNWIMCEGRPKSAAGGQLKSAAFQTRLESGGLMAFLSPQVMIMNGPSESLRSLNNPR
jgi:hypothetical protein